MTPIQVIQVTLWGIASASDVWRCWARPWGRIFSLPIYPLILLFLTPWIHPFCPVKSHWFCSSWPASTSWFFEIYPSVPKPHSKGPSVHAFAQFTIDHTPVVDTATNCIVCIVHCIQLLVTNELPLASLIDSSGLISPPGGGSKYLSVKEPPHGKVPATV